jgi:peptidyl-prolyl cis-trans isomerase SurA
LKRISYLALLAAGVCSIAPLRAEIIEQVLVKVNGEIITSSEFERRQLAELIQTRPELAKLPPNSPQLAVAVSEAAPTLILSAVDELLLLQRAKEHGWVLTDERFKDIIGDIRKNNNLQDEAAFKKALEQEGLTEADLRKSIERDMLIGQVRRADVTEKISVNDQEIREYYEANPREFTSPAEITIREILIAVPTSDRGVNVAEDDAAAAKAEEVRSRALAGESFATLATEFSASNSKVDGGLVGPLKLDDLAPALQDVIKPLKIGEIAPLLKTTRGYQIFKLESRSETKIRTLDEARGDVSRRVAEQKTRGETLRFLEKLREQANIVWRNDELKKAYDKALADRRVLINRTEAPAPPQ